MSRKNFGRNAGARPRLSAMLRAPFFICLALCVLPFPARAVQSLIPSPYPDAGPGAAPLDPEPQGIGGPQTLMRDPYPQITGDESQGNPPITRHHRHQRRVPSVYQRKYRVDRP